MIAAQVPDGTKVLDDGLLWEVVQHDEFEVILASVDPAAAADSKAVFLEHDLTLVPDRLEELRVERSKLIARCTVPQRGTFATELLHRELDDVVNEITWLQGAGL